MKTERLNLLLSPEEKALLDERAKGAGMTASEFVRRALGTYDPEVDMEELRALAQELAGVADRMEKRLDANLSAIAELRERLADRDALKAAALAELNATDRLWPFDLPDSTPRFEAAES